MNKEGRNFMPSSEFGLFVADWQGIPWSSSNVKHSFIETRSDETVEIEFIAGVHPEWGEVFYSEYSQGEETRVQTTRDRRTSSSQVFLPENIPVNITKIRLENSIYLMDDAAG